MENLTTNQALAGGAVLGGIVATALIIVLAIYIVFIVAAWKIFTKAGVAGWKSLIPIYNVYKFCQIIGISFWVYIIIIPFILGVVSAIINNNNITTAIDFAYSLVIDIYIAIKLAKSFGKGTGFIVGLVLFQPIFELILAFGSSKYVGDYKEA